jgi:DNA-binding GntR family transcriptional regulator
MLVRRQESLLIDESMSRVDVSTLQERVYLEMRDALSQGRFAPGSALTLRSLAAALGTSPMPVREAIQRLVAEKALEQMPNRTIRVPTLTAEVFDELIRIRMVVEGFAAQRAAQRSTPELCARLRAMNAGFRDAIAAGDSSATMEKYRIFRLEICRAADADMLLQTIESLRLRLGPVVSSARNLPGANAMFSRFVDIHERIVDALEQRDSARARFSLTLAIRAGANWVRRNYRFNAVSP